MFTEGEVSFDEAAPLLARCGLYPVDRADHRVGIWDAQGTLAATGALVGDMLQMIAVDPAWQGEDLAARVVSHLVRRASASGRSCVYLIAKRGSAPMFSGMGFATVAETDAALLLEWGAPGIAAYCEQLASYKTEHVRTGCVVMNANPFTLGHRYLVERALAVCPRVIVIVVREDVSAFPFDVRLQLVQAGLRDLPGVTVLPGSRYVISSMTFPAYFVRDAAKSRAEGELDAALFGTYLAPALGVRDRFIGTEPASPSTRAYNDALKRILPPLGVAVHELPRMEAGGAPVSASDVRRRIAAGMPEDAAALVPETTYAYLLENREAVTNACRNAQ